MKKQLLLLVTSFTLVACSNAATETAEVEQTDTTTESQSSEEVVMEENSTEIPEEVSEDAESEEVLEEQTSDNERAMEAIIASEPELVENRENLQFLVGEIDENMLTVEILVNSPTDTHANLAGIYTYNLTSEEIQKQDPLTGQFESVENQ